MTILNGVPLEDTFAEAFPMTAARAIVTAETLAWAEIAGRTMTGLPAYVWPARPQRAPPPTA